MKEGEASKAKKVKVPQRSAVKTKELRRPGRVLREGPPPAQLPGESDRDYGLLVAFWHKGGALSLRQLAAELGVRTQLLSKVRGVRSWDARVQAALEEPPEVKASWSNRREALREQEWQLHRECLAAGRAALRQWQESGQVARLGEVVKLLEFAAKLARLAAGMPETHLAISGEDGEPIRLQFESALAQAYGPVVDVVAEAVDKAEGKAKDDDDTGKITELRTALAAMEGSQGGGSELRGAPARALRVGQGNRPHGGDVREDQGAVGTEEDPGV